MSQPGPLEMLGWGHLLTTRGYGWIMAWAGSLVLWTSPHPTQLWGHQDGDAAGSLSPTWCFHQQGGGSAVSLPWSQISR